MSIETIVVELPGQQARRSCVAYQITHTHRSGSWLDSLFSVFSGGDWNWSYSEAPVVAFSQREVASHLRAFLDNKYFELKEKRQAGKRKRVYTFLSIPHEDSDAARCPALYPPHYVDVTIKEKNLGR